MDIAKIAKTVGENLKWARTANKLTQKQLAAELHQSASYYGSFEKGKAELGYYNILYLCKRLDITPNDLFEIY